MNESGETPPPRQPLWPQAALVAVLTAQVGLLWLFGGLLNRQHGEIQAMRQDIQELTEALDNGSFEQGQAPEEGRFQPASSSPLDPLNHRPHRPHRRHHRRRHLQATSNLHVVLQDKQDNAPDKQDPTMKEMQEVRDSSKKAVADARDIRQKLSIDENIRKADEKKKVEAATKSFYPIIYWAMGIGLAAFLIGRVWRARAGGR